MRIGVVSDSHGHMQSLRTAVREMADIDMLLHVGDHYLDAIRLEQELDIPVYAVTGNCDWESTGPAEEIIEIEGKRILLTHGHNQGVKNGYTRLLDRLSKEDYDVIIFGHTHIPEVLKEGNRYLFNPGSVAKPRIDRAKTYGVIEIQKDRLFLYIKELSG